jgi:hypothetical protein
LAKMAMIFRLICGHPLSGKGRKFTKEYVS